MMTDAELVQYGVPHSLGWADQLDMRARAALRMLIPARSVVAAVGSWGRRDGCDGCPIVAYVDSESAHAAIIMDELRWQLKGIQFIVPSRSPAMQVAMVDARIVWGHRGVQRVTTENVARWAAALLRSCEHPDLPVFHVKHLQTAMGHWVTCRTIMRLAGMQLPQPLDMPGWYHAVVAEQNSGRDDDDQYMRQHLGLVAMSALHLLADGDDLAAVAATVRSDVLH